jgi:Mg2+ and Co2+ transporter CorA
MNDQNQEAYDKAMEELDQVEKSMQTEQEDELDALTKALEEEIAGEDLNKSEDESDVEKSKKKPQESDKDDEDCEEDKEMEKSDHYDFDDELVKASEAYADLTKSVEDGIGGLYAELDAMKKSMAALMNLNIKQAKVIAEMVKSRKDDVEAINKSLQIAGAAPMAPNKAVIGLGRNDESPMQKSVSDIQDQLLKAVQEGRVQSQYLSMFGTYKNIDMLPEEVKQAIGC